MPRFYFNVHDGITALDREGVELAGLQEARVQAVRTAGAIIAENATHIVQCEDWCMNVTDETGLTLYRLDFSLTASAATTKPLTVLDPLSGKSVAIRRSEER